MDTDTVKLGEGICRPGREGDTTGMSVERGFSRYNNIPKVGGFTLQDILD
jgi:hypothetical protein